MEFFIVRTIDHAVYFETRLVLLFALLGLAIFQQLSRRENRYLVILLSSVVMTALVEYLFMAVGLRGPGYAISLFGHTLPHLLVPPALGLLDGSTYGVMALWFADLRMSRAGAREWLGYLAFTLLVLGLSVFTGMQTHELPITGARAVFGAFPIAIITTIIFFSLLIAWKREALPFLANFYAGLILFSVVNLEPLHLLGSRYVGQSIDLRIVAAPLKWQVIIMPLSHIYESSGGRLHLLTVALAFGLIRGKRRSVEEAEPLSYQHLQSLTERGWRKRSKPFMK